MQNRTCAIATGILATLVYSSVNATEIKSVWGHVENLECATPSSIVMEKARNDALETLGDYTQYQQVNRWFEFDYYLNKDGNAIDAVEENLDQCVSHEGIVSASFVEKKTMNEDWYITYESFADCSPHFDLSEEESWARALKSATDSARWDCSNAVKFVSVERIGITYEPAFNENCYEIKARFQCMKPNI